MTRTNTFRLRALALPILIAGLGAAPIADTTAHAATPTATPATAPATAVVQHTDTPAAPVAGLDATQMAHAKTIVDTAHDMHLPERAAVIAVATSMQETNLYNLANTGLPESQTIPNDGTGYDHDSVGLFQQRPASGWGPVDQLMDPATSTRKFLQALEQVPGWQDMPITVAAQTVQGSAFPDAYTKHQANAETVVDAITK